MCPKRERSGFTLVELLVVIGIIAVLISILLPTLAGARSRAASVQCLSNLRQQGQAMVMYAQVNKGFLPTAATGATIYVFSQTQAEQLAMLMKGNTKIYYCPSNELLPPGTQPQITPDDFYPPYAGKPWPGGPPTGTGGRILYWWVANPNASDWPDKPNRTGTGDDMARFAPVGAPPTPPGGTAPPPYVVFRDVDGDGVIRDEYMRRLGDKNVSNIVVSTDWSGQIGGTNRGWFFLHGKQAWMAPTAPVADRKKLYRSWKNNLYGDGHAESKRPDEVEWRWGPGGPACW